MQSCPCRRQIWIKKQSLFQMLQSMAHSSLSTALRKQKSKTVSVHLLGKGLPVETASVFLGAEGWIPGARGRTWSGSAPPATQAGVCPALCAPGFTGVQRRCTRGRGRRLGCLDLIRAQFGRGWESCCARLGFKSSSQWGDQALAPALDGNEACRLLGSYVRLIPGPTRLSWLSRVSVLMCFIY